MNLHRTTGSPDWADVKPGNRNVWQSIAAKTNGIITPANLMTAVGACLVALGLYFLVKEQYLVSIALLGLGRLADIADGWLAHKTGTKSPLGEILDAGIDKIATAAIIVTLLLTKTVNPWLLLAILLPHVIISATTLFARSRKINIHPSRLGKLSMALAWISLLGLIFLYSYSAQSVSFLSILTYSTVSLSISLSVLATIGYIKTTLETK